MFWLGIPLGCLGIVMIHHLVGGTWGFVIQRSLESAIRTFPIMAVLFLPLLFGLPDLFIWAHPQAVAQDPVLLQKAAYLNIPAFIVRAACVFRSLDAPRVFQPLVGGTGPQRRPRAHAAAANSKRAGAGPVRARR